MDSITSTIVTSILSVVGVGLGGAVVYLRKKVKHLGGQASEATGFYQTLSAVVELIDDIIMASHAIVLKELEEKLSDGKLDSAEIREIVESVKEEVLKVLNERSIQDLKFITNDIDKFLETKVRAAIVMFLKRLK